MQHYFTFQINYKCINLNFCAYNMYLWYNASGFEVFVFRRRNNCFDTKRQQHINIVIERTKGNSSYNIPAAAATN